MVHNIADLILQNVDKAESTGLYNGRAGLSLSLFAAAEYLRDERIEDAAYKLLQESLILKNNSASFENGLPGVGYALLFLIENKYLEADFDEIFGNQYESIMNLYKNIEKDPFRLINSFKVIYFFSKVGNIKKEDARIPVIIKKRFLKDWNCFSSFNFLIFMIPVT